MDDLDHGTLEQLAEAAHIVWMDGKLRDGWKYGALTDKTKKIHSCLVPYDQLSEADKQSDRDIVLRIQEILSAVGYKIIKAEG
jgi:hypothetical protein